MSDTYVGGSHQVRILVVDDEDPVCQSLNHWFHEDGCVVETATDASDALNQLKGKRFDLALVDIKMPGMDGIALQKQIQKIDPDLHVIMLTTNTSVDSAVEALRQGAFDYVTKPVDHVHLMHIAHNAARQRRLSLDNSRLEREVSRLMHEDPRSRDVRESEAADAFSDTMSMEAVEKQHMACVLKKTGGNVTRAAEILGINRVTLYNKIKKYHLK